MIHDKETGQPYPGGGGGDRSLAAFSGSNITPIGAAWKESASNDPRPPNRRSVAMPLIRNIL